MRTHDETTPSECAVCPAGLFAASPEAAECSVCPTGTDGVTRYAPFLFLDFGTGSNIDGVDQLGFSPSPWITIPGLAQDEVVDLLGNGITITALDDGFYGNNAGAPGTSTVIEGVMIPQEARDDYFYKTIDTAGTTARLRIDGLPTNTYRLTLFEGRTTDNNRWPQFGVVSSPLVRQTLAILLEAM